MKQSPLAVVAAVIKQNSCTTCTRFEKLGKVADAADHPHGKCYKNFGSTVSVQSQEAITAAEIFHSATEKMGYALTQCIGDNDSESFMKIVFNHVYCCAEFCKVARHCAECKIKVWHNVHP